MDLTLNNLQRLISHKTEPAGGACGEEVPVV